MSRSMVLILFVLFQFLCVSVKAQSTSTDTTTEFVFRGFKKDKSEIQTEGAATIEPNGILRLTDQKSNVTGTAFYNKPVRLLDHSNLTTKASIRSFSTSFVFSIFPSSSRNGGFGFTFTLSPTPNRQGAESGKYLGLFNKVNDGNPENHVFAVEFSSVQGVIDGSDIVGNHIGLNFNSQTSDVQEPVVYYDLDDRQENIQLQSGKPIRAILDYDGPTQMLYLTIYPAVFPPRKPLTSHHVPKLSEIVQEEMYVGFTAATGKKLSSIYYMMGWSFFSDGDRLAAARLAVSDLPLPNDLMKGSSDNPALGKKILIVVGSIVSILLVMGVLVFFVRKRTIGYIAPEMISRVYGSVSHKSDVYSYGMLVLEMIGATNKDRFEKAASNTSSIYFPDWIYKNLENGQHNKLLGDELTREEEEITKKMILVALWCIQSCPSNRPSMNRVVEMMEGSLVALEVPPKPVLHFPAAPLQDSSTLSDDISVYVGI